ncbi:glutamine-hydrolyzing GMP synthase [Candidatus Bipolaricaulota bacterium]|nr:glutamine-hydrolyzing GMP synthase [Candidatus Bipolaricaulota bacterium]
MDKIGILDFGGQYSHLIGRRIRDLGVFARVFPAEVSAEEVARVEGLKGVIFSGGAASVHEGGSPKPDRDILDLGLPILGICYGHQLLSSLFGGEVVSSGTGEYGTTGLELTGEKSSLLDGMEEDTDVWMNHKDSVLEPPAGSRVTGRTEESPVGVFEDDARGLYGVQFHPEVTHTDQGDRILHNFAVRTCGAEPSWDPRDLVPQMVEDARHEIGDRRAIIGLSGGVDSSTAAKIVSEAIGKNLTAVYVDTGLMREGETQSIRDGFQDEDLRLQVVDESDRFLDRLEGVEDPETKRKIIGKTFIDSFTEVAEDLGADVLIQGTIYSDRIESGATTHSDTIKSHHNVGGIPEEMDLEIYEPLRDLYKDEVRRIAREVGVPDKIVHRHVFPGPGLAIRIIGEVTRKRVEIVRHASKVVEDKLREAGLYRNVWMGFAVLLPIKSVGVQGDLRSYKSPVAIRIVESEDAMTANFSRIPYEVLEDISTQITNEIGEVNRVVYDISNKPPATMEWE